MALSAVGLFIFFDTTLLYIAIALIGFGNSNIFLMMFSKALQSLPERDNEISGLMIMGVAGGAIFPLLMGVAFDVLGCQEGTVIVVAALVIYLEFLTAYIRDQER
jgi:fucose permease